MNNTSVYRAIYLSTMLAMGTPLPVHAQDAAGTQPKADAPVAVTNTQVQDCAKDTAATAAQAVTSQDETKAPSENKESTTDAKVDDKQLAMMGGMGMGMGTAGAGNMGMSGAGNMGMSGAGNMGMSGAGNMGMSGAGNMGMGMGGMSSGNMGMGTGGMGTLSGPCGSRTTGTGTGTGTATGATAGSTAGG